MSLTVLRSTGAHGTADRRRVPAHLGSVSVNEHLHVRLGIANADPASWHVMDSRSVLPWLTVLQQLDADGWELVTTVRIPNTRVAEDPEMVAIFRRLATGPLD
jgi:hypothetical protein